MTLRVPGLTLTFVATLLLCGCVDSLRSQPTPKWTIGFWYWQGNSAEASPARGTPDALYFHAGSIWRNGAPEQWYASVELPKSLPDGREYWLVFREDGPAVPDAALAAVFGNRVRAAVELAHQRHLKIAGVQLDIDCPTSQLSRYAEALRAIRKEMPKGMGISVTALLDWFRDGTSVGDVIRETDEFVPQFYDVDSSGPGYSRPIAAKIDATRWGPRLNKFGKRYRIGISTFGRARLVPREGGARGGYAGFRLYGDLKPIDIAGNTAFQTATSYTDAGELLLRYGAQKNVQISASKFQTGDAVEFVIPTREAVHRAVEAARRMGGLCSGVVFFRWPAANESMVLQPDEVLAAAGTARQQEVTAALELADAQCAAVRCVDVYLLNARGLSSSALKYRIRSSTALEYFLPEKSVQIRMTDSSHLELTVPAYGGTGRMLLGRAMTKKRGEFEVEEER